MTLEEENERAEYVRLHRALDELLACYLGENIERGRRTSIHDEILDLMKWTHAKTLEPGESA